MIYENIAFVSGNKNKVEEFNQMIKGMVHRRPPNVLEVKSQDELEVTIHKLKDIMLAMKNSNIYNDPYNMVYFIEDTSLQIEGESVGTDIKHILDSINQFAGKRAKWIVTLAVTNNSQVEIYQGFIEGSITSRPYGSNGFGFDTYFIPDNQIEPESYLTLAQMTKRDKNYFSARANAVKSFHKGPSNALKLCSIKDIPEWNGEYQIEDED